MHSRGPGRPSWGLTLPCHSACKASLGWGALGGATDSGSLSKEQRQRAWESPVWGNKQSDVRDGEFEGA